MYKTHTLHYPTQLIISDSPHKAEWKNYILMNRVNASLISLRNINIDLLNFHYSRIVIDTSDADNIMKKLKQFQIQYCRIYILSSDDTKMFRTHPAFIYET